MKKKTNNDMQNVWAALQVVTGGNGGSIMFIGLSETDEISYCAREFAKLAATRTVKSAWLMDLDFYSRNQYREFENAGYEMDGPFDMSFGQIPFWRVVPKNSNNTDVDSKVIVSYRVGKTRLFVSDFNADIIQEGQVLQIGSAPDYWNAIKNSVEYIVIDAPPIEVSNTGLVIASQMDAIVMVIDSKDGNPNQAIQLRDEIINKGGNIIGIILKDAKKK